MKVTIKTDYTVALDGIRITEFLAGQEVELSQEDAEKLISRGVAEENKVVSPVKETKVATPVKGKK